MSTWLVTRHAGAADWLIQQGFKTDQLVTHLDISKVATGDVVIGTLPVNSIAELHTKGARYFHLSLTVPPEMRGKELSAKQMKSFGATLAEYIAFRVDDADGNRTNPKIPAPREGNE